MLPPEARAPVIREDIVDAAFTDSAPDNYRRLREIGPVLWMPAQRAFLLTNHEDSARALRDPLLVGVDVGTIWRDVGERLGRDYGRVLRLIDHMPFHQQGATHAWQRRCLAIAFAPYALGGPAVAKRVGMMAEDLRRRDKFDLVKDFSHALLFEIVADIVGLDEATRDLVRPLNSMSWVVDQLIPVARRDAFAEAFEPTMAVLIDRAAEADRKGDSEFLSALRAAMPEEHRSDEAVAFYMAIVFLMGSDAVSGCIAFPVRDFLDEEAGTALAQEDWHTTTADSIRLTSPIHVLPREAVGDVTYGGVDIAAGEKVMVGTLSADTDPVRYGAGASAYRPDGDVGLAFGAGPHICVGNRFARAVVGQAFEALSGLPRLRAAGPSLLGMGSFMRRITSLPVEYV